VIIPSIDLMDGKAVQLVGGCEKVLDAGDPLPIAEQFRLAGEIAVVDLDAALGRGSNAEIIKQLIRIAPCRVGGGIRDAQTAISWLDEGAAKVVLGTAAEPEVLKKLPQERVIAALDAMHGEVVVEGWQKKTGKGVIERMRQLEGLVGGFLVTFVEREGRMKGTALDQIETLKATCGQAGLAIAGGFTTPEEIAAADRMGADAQVGMALYSGHLSLADAIAAPLVSDRQDGLWPTVVTDEHGIALGLAYSDPESLREAVRTKRGVYRSRSRGLWVKGATSGASQELLRINLDCDRDTMRFVVRQHGSGYCHKGTMTCWGEEAGIFKLARRLAQRAKHAPPDSYTRKLLDSPQLLREKLIEEARELSETKNPDETIWETADLLYFALVAMIRGGVSLSDVEKELDRRALVISRRPDKQKSKGNISQ